MSSRSCYDVVVLGSGFGGSLLAAILSRGGLSVAMCDRVRHPRFAIGESSTPAADLLLRQIAIRHGLNDVLPLTKFGTWRDAYPQLNCGCKRGFSYFSHSGPFGFRATAAHESELLVAASSSRETADTHWYRADVDAFLAQIAANNGVDVMEGAAVADIRHSGPHDWLLSITHDRSSRPLEAAFVVDATGPAGMLMNRLAIPDATRELLTRSAAVYSHWRDVQPAGRWLTKQNARFEDYPYPVEDSVIHHLFGDGWLWQIPFADGTTSLGFVYADPAGTMRDSSAAGAWTRVLKDHQSLLNVLGPMRLAETPGEVIRTGRLQRLWSIAAGDDWAALPYTVGFIDPLHSTGIAHTLSGVDRLGRLLLEACGDRRSDELQAYARMIPAELRLIDRLVAGCYATLGDFRLFTAWSMAYFGAATMYERKRLAAPDGNAAFLCADDPQFARLVCDLYEQLLQMRNEGQLVESAAIDGFVARIRDELAPYNHVGLFEPAAPNMYWHTALDT